MKLLLNFVCVLLLFAGTCAASEKAQVVEMDFYPNGAKFIFECETDEDGKFELELPTTFSQITDWSSTPGLRPGWIPPFLRGLDTTIKKGREKLNEFEAKILSLQQTLTLLGSPKTQNDNFGDLLGFIRDAQALSEKTAIEISKIKSERDDLKSKIDLFEMDFNSKMPNDASYSLQISGSGEKNSKVRVEAFSNFASWAPRQIMKLDSQTGKIDAELHAMTSQKTGIDGQGTIRFHTNVPQNDVGLPELPPKIVDIRPAAPVVPMPRQALAKSEVMDNSAVYGAMPMLPPEMVSKLAAVTVRGSGKVIGNGVEEDISLGKYTIDSNVSLIAVPEYGDAVYIVAETAPLKQPIIGGAGVLYVDGAASSSPYIKSYGEGERAKITFGTTPLIKTERKDIVSKSDTSWWGTSGKLNDGYNIRVTNGMPSEQKVTVIDRIPVSASGQITVANVKFDPAPKEKSDENIITWEISLKPGESANISVSYTLEFPAAESLMFR